MWEIYKFITLILALEFDTVKDTCKKKSIAGTKPYEISCTHSQEEKQKLPKRPIVE